MNDRYVLDACAVIALLTKESGYENVRDLIDKAADKEIILKINQVNLLEVYYDQIKVYGQIRADETLSEMKAWPIEVVTELSGDVFREAGRVKTLYKIPLGDSIALAECIIGDGILVTSDRNDFEKAGQAEKIKVFWFR